MLQPTRGKITCWACGTTINGARTVIDGYWHCADCTYRHDYPERQVKEVAPAKPLKAQKETLFEPPPKREKTRERHLD